MRRVAAGCVTIAFVAGTGASFATQGRSLVPGDPSVSGAAIRPYASEWEVIQRGGDGVERVTGRWEDVVEIAAIDGVEYLRRSQTSYDPEGGVTNRQLHLMNRQTLAPLRSHLSAGQMVKHVDFGPESVAAYLLLDPAQSLLAMEESAPSAFDFSVAGLLLVGMGLRPDETVEFPSYVLEPTGMTEPGHFTGLRLSTETVRATAHGAEVIDAGAGGERLALRVAVPRGNRTLTFWLADEPPYILRLAAESPSGTTLWRMR